MTALESPYSSRLPVALRVSKLPPACPATHASKQRAFRAGRRGCLQGPGARLTETEKMTELVGTDVGARGDARGLVAHEAACTPQIAVAVWTRVVRRDGRIFVDVAHHAYEAIADGASPVGAARRARRLWLVVEDSVYLRLADRIDLVPGGMAWARGARGAWKEPHGVRGSFQGMPGVRGSWQGLPARSPRWRKRSPSKSNFADRYRRCPDPR